MNHQLQKFKKFNLLMSFVHFVQVIAVFFLSKDFKLPISVGFLNFNPIEKKLFPAQETIFELPLAWLIVAFLLISSLAHLIIATVYNKTYNKNLEQGINKARWIEYAFSASTMMVAISLLVGIYDLSSLIMIFSLTAVMNLMGLVMEVHNQTTKKTNWLSFNIGVFAGAIPWIVVAIFFWSANSYGNGNIPSFVYWIYVSIFIFFNCFAINMVLQYAKKGKWKTYLYGEMIYVLLSLLAKSALAWQVFAGTLRP